MSYVTHALKQARRRKAPAAAIPVALAAAILPLCAAPASYGAGQDLRKFNQFVQTSNTPSMRMLREGRDLIDAEEWAKAAEKFNQFVNAYPKDRDMDAALYWLAYSLRRLGDARGAVEPLRTLLKRHAQSPWADEARAMLNEIAGDLRESSVPVRTLNDDKEKDEIRIIALRSLYDASPERALGYISEILKPGSAESPRMKEAAISLLGSRGGPAAMAILLDIARTSTDANLRARAVRSLGEEGGESMLDELFRLYDSERDREVKRQILHALFEKDESARARTKLLQIARSSTEDQELRRTAIHRLGEKKGASAYDDLAQIYAAEQNAEIKRQILHAFSDMEDPRGRARLMEIARSQGENTELRRAAIHWLGEQGGEPALDELMKIYRADRDSEIRRQILHALSDMKSPRARALLVEAAKAGDSVELRRAAIHHLADEDDAPTLDMLISLYDAEANDEIKRQLLHAFGESKQKRALQKLMDVARRDKSVELRKQAIHALGESDDPEALRFLEELLKP